MSLRTADDIGTQRVSLPDLLGYLIDETDLINEPGVDLGRLMHLLGSGAVG